MDVELPWDAISAVTRRTRTREDKAPRLSRADGGPGTLHLWMQERTDVDDELDRPVTVRLPEGTGAVTAVHLHADDPEGFLDQVRQVCQPPAAR